MSIKHETLEPLSVEEIILAQEGELNVSELVWRSGEEYQPLKMFSDIHIRNAVLKLIGFAKEEYDAPEELKLRWLTALKLEWQKRLAERNVTLKE